MHKIRHYTLLFLAAVLFQALLFGNLDLAVWLHPLYYPVFLILLPVETAPVLLLLAGFAVGGAVDLATGTAGLHAASATLAAFLRPGILHLTAGRNLTTEGGIPSPSLMGRNRFLQYAGLTLLVHATACCLLETLGSAPLWLVVARIIAGSAASLLFVWLTALLFVSGPQPASPR